MSDANTLFLRLEGPLQAWGDTSKFVVRRTMEAPTKSGVLGMLCCAMGLSRGEARGHLRELNTLVMGVRIDRPGTRWWDYHTVGAGTGLTTASGGLKTGAQGTLITRREYLADASFLVALQGDAQLIHKLAVAMASPKWPIFLGRKSCPPSVPVLAGLRKDEPWKNPAHFNDLKAALEAVPWRPRYGDSIEPSNKTVDVLVEWRSASENDLAPEDAQVWFDVPVAFDPPVHEPRFVLRDTVSPKVGHGLQEPLPPVPRPRANYTQSQYRQRRQERIEADGGVCVFCKSPGPRITVQHVTYRRAGGSEALGDLRTLCGLCHDAVTMLEYGMGMGLERIDPEEPRWREQIIRKRDEILRYRSLETRRRRLTAEEVE